jgi:serine/threonine protein kinase
MYLPPEVAQGATPTPQFDIYALGITMYQLMTGRRPYRGKVSLELLKARLLSDPIPPSSANPMVSVSPEVEAVVLRAMEKDPARRFGSAQALASAILSTLPRGASAHGWNNGWTAPAGAPAPSELVDDDAVTKINVAPARALSPASTSHGVPPSPGEVARGFEQISGASRGIGQVPETRDDELGGAGTSTSGPFTASASTLGMSAARRFEPELTDAQELTESLVGASTGVSRAQLVIAVSVAALMMVIGLVALILALGR